MSAIDEVPIGLRGYYTSLNCICKPVINRPLLNLLLVPIIEEHPKSGMVELGKDLTLVCKAVGKNLRFTWYKNTKCLIGEVSVFSLSFLK